MKIGQLELQANDLSVQRHFYEDVLGLPLITSDGTLLVQVGSSQLVFRQAPPTPGPAYHFAFNIPQGRFDEAKAWLSERVALITSSTGEDSFDFTNWNAHSCYFRDPAGNILEFIARHNLSDHSDAPFSSQGILSISEVGIATDDVEATVQSLQGLGLPIYDGEGSDTFTAVGDEHGLCIVVRRGRIWFPDTGTPAECFPLKVTVSIAPGAAATLSGPPYQINYTNP